MSRTALVRILTAALLVITATAPLHADKIVLKDGQTFVGRVISQDKNGVSFEWNWRGKKTLMTYKTNEVKQVLVDEPAAPSKKAEAQSVSQEKDADGGATYFIIPIKGTFGVEITDEMLKRCFDIARKTKPTVIVFDIDSVGGNVAELNRMLNTLHKHNDLRCVAYVRKAISTAGLFAMACKEIVIAPEGTIAAEDPASNRAPAGSRRVFSRTGNAIREKETPSRYQAEYRAFAEQAGHDPLLVEALININCMLFIAPRDNKSVLRIRHRSPNSYYDGVRSKGEAILKPWGRPLALTAKQSVQCKLAVGISKDVYSMYEVLGLDKWKEQSKAGIRLAQSLGQTRKTTEKKFWALVTDSFVLLRESDAKWLDSYSGRIGLSQNFINEIVLSKGLRKNFDPTLTERVQALKRAKKQLEKVYYMAARNPDLIREEVILSKIQVGELRNKVAKMHLKEADKLQASKNKRKARRRNRRRAPSETRVIRR